MGLLKKADKSDKMEKMKIEPVPVYTVPTIPRPYEIVGTVSTTRVASVMTFGYTKTAAKMTLDELGKLAAEQGADAVIGMFGVYINKADAAWFYGTAIKYVD